MRYSGRKSAAISFPLGGIGSGCVGLAGNGGLIDWEIFNRANKGSINGASHFAVRAERNGKVEDIRILQGDRQPPYTGDGRNFGWGPDADTMCGWPHFRNHVFDGRFPCSRIEFGDEEKFPARAALDAWSVFIPGESRNSTLPAAFFEVTLENNRSVAYDYTVVGVLANPWWRTRKEHFNRVEGRQLTVSAGDGSGEITLTLCDTNEEFSFQTDSYRGTWRDALEMYYNDLRAGGRFRERIYSPEAKNSRSELELVPDFGLLAAHFPLAPGEKKTVRFVLSWHVPECRNDWEQDADQRAADDGVRNCWKVYYATVWSDSRDSGRYAAEQFEELRAKTYRFCDALNAVSLPPEVVDGISANLAVLKSPTCLRLEDGTFWGWEGVGNSWGSCPGSCAHVWNYAQALPFLFPDLERSMREAHLKYGTDSAGGHHFRLRLPLGIRARTDDFRPCADGQFGEIMKFYREWKISADAEFLKRWWPTLRKLLEYAWSDQNPDQWDPERSGVLHGRQHHTLDMELFGPNFWLTAHYLGALKAMARMAEAMEEEEFARQCSEIYERGRRWAEKNLFNGEYFIQKLDLADRALLEKFHAESYWNAEAGQIKYQLGEGCGIDGALAQWYATLYGLGELCDPELVRKHLRSVLRYNFRTSMRDAANLWRIYSLNDEAGTIICSWPGVAKRPAVPIPYNSETMTGFEWAFAGLLLQEGLIEEGFKVGSAIRFRFDGERRNPWNEFECGNNYARSMASYGMLLSASGFQFDLGRGMIGFAPIREEFTTFWSLGDIWGAAEFSCGRAKIELLHGEFNWRSVRLPFEYRKILRNGGTVQFPFAVRTGDVVEFEK